MLENGGDRKKNKNPRTKLKKGETPKKTPNANSYEIVSNPSKIFYIDPYPLSCVGPDKNVMGRWKCFGNGNFPGGDNFPGDEGIRFAVASVSQPP